MKEVIPGNSPSEKFDLSENWELETMKESPAIFKQIAIEAFKKGLSDQSLDSLSVIILKAASEALKYALADDETYFYFPIEWEPDSDGMGNKAPSDPSTLYWTIALNDFGDGPVYSMSLRSILKKTLNECAGDGTWSQGLNLLALDLAKLVDEINEAVDKGARK